MEEWFADRLGPGGDDFYEALVQAHRGLSREESAALNARLVLMLANYVGDVGVLTTFVARARSAQQLPPSASEDATLEVKPSVCA
ncbi:MAG TPA: DUF2783 domain-containing protein [Kiloniellales bacterium]|jgi:hypothetical protein|nr:DUF2783 domain-containing protein [Kiloniellales bacterium]